MIPAAAAEIERRWGGSPRAGLILGTGLGGLASHIEKEAEIPYQEIPHFHTSTALAHAGRLVCGRLAGVPVVAMQGRCHLYEGYSADQVALPVWVMAELGVERLIVSNAAGGLNPQFEPGDIMLLDGHIDLMWNSPHPLSATSADTLLTASGRSASSPYCSEMLASARRAAQRNGFTAPLGTYVAVSGPSYETRAEYRMFRAIGGDAVGMSTVPEVLAAHSRGVRVLAISAITNVALPDSPVTVDAQHVVDAAQTAAPKMQLIVEQLMREVDES